MGLLQPHGGHRRRDGQADLSRDATFEPSTTSIVRGKRVLLRVDLNVPMADGEVSDPTRIERMAPTVAEIAAKGGKVILLSHFGRPKGRNAQGFAQARRRRARPAICGATSPLPTTASARSRRRPSPR